MKVNHVTIAVVGSLLILAALAVILLPAYAGDSELSARPVQKRTVVYKVKSAGDDLTARAALEEECGAAEATGRSESFSFDEAFTNALDALPEDTTPVYPDKMTAVRVVDIYATFGGITGGAYLYVRVRREPDPVCLSNAEQQEVKPRVGKIRMQLGEMKKLPDREIKLGEITKPKPIEEK